MKKLIADLVKSIPSGLVFDSHTVIQLLLQRHTPEYLNGVKGGSNELYHAQIGKWIAELEGSSVERAGKSYSKSIRDEFSENPCWKRI